MLLYWSWNHSFEGCDIQNNMKQQPMLWGKADCLIRRHTYVYILNHHMACSDRSCGQNPMNIFLMYSQLIRSSKISYTSPSKDMLSTKYYSAMLLAWPNDHTISHMHQMICELPCMCSYTIKCIQNVQLLWTSNWTVIRPGHHLAHKWRLLIPGFIEYVCLCMCVGWQVTLWAHTVLVIHLYVPPPKCQTTL